MLGESNGDTAQCWELDEGTGGTGQCRVRALGTLLSACTALCRLSHTAPSAWAPLLLPLLAEQANVNSCG